MGGVQVNTIGVALLSYLASGLLVLGVFDIITGRVRKNIRSAGLKAQLRMAEANNPIGVKVGMVLMLVLTWLFWSIVLIGAATDKGEVGQETKIQRQEPTTRYLLKRLWYGECPDCRVILKPMDAWGQYSICPVCGTEFKGLRLKASKEGNNGKTEQRKDSKNRAWRGRVDSSSAGEKDSKQPTGASDTETG